MWKLVCVLCVLPHLVSATARSERASSDAVSKDKRSTELRDHKNLQHQLGVPQSGNTTCVDQDFHGVPSNCSQFYRCVPSGHTFVKFNFNCPGGTVWDDQGKSCNFRSAVPFLNCKDHGEPTTNVSRKVYREPPRFVLKYRLTKTELLYVCPSTIRRHPLYCNIIYQCNVEKLYTKFSLMYCPDNSFYDPAKLQCVKNMPPPTDCMLYSNQTVFNRLRSVHSFNPLCTEIGHTNVSSDPCEEHYLSCQLNEAYGFMEAVFMQCQNGVFVPSKKQCVAKADVPECIK